MFDLDSWEEIWVTITRNKFRSFLTGFGIFWGIFILIAIVAVGNGFKGGVSALVKGFAENSCFFSASVTSESYKGYKKGRSWHLNYKDVTRIQKKAASVKYVSPVLIQAPTDNNIVRERNSGSFSIRGVYPTQFIVEKQNLLYGRLFNSADILNERKVCIIGKEVYEALFAYNEDPVGKQIRIKGFYYQVIGVISPVSQVSIGGNVELTVFIPFSTMQQTFQKNDIIHYIACTAKDGYTTAMVEEEVKGLLEEAHNISPTDKKAINSFNIEREFLIFNYLFQGADILIWIVGLGSLLSGVIGVSNIMLVTVKERTREIGIRRALGAKPLTIVRQIISESFVLTMLFGIAGLSSAIIFLEIVDIEMSKHSFEDMLFIPPFISFYTAMLAFLILCMAGLLSGLIPSTRALNIKAIDAIREE